ncbi:CAAX prenyl protease 1 homolog [Phymastichus coffea]|uniref:CAAX prenyl protease 1 homolog n=1 Tax=Phymastichus coffea TaxID=108790 RepID=UPI00273BE59D|nr:CAAX prenyl protease 1 homolog [Phymastichus coffea]
MDKSLPLSVPVLPEQSFFEKHILAELVIISWLLCLWERYLALRQRKLMQKLKDPPQLLDGLISEDVYRKSRTYALDNNTFGHFQDFYTNVLSSLYMIYYGFYYSWTWGEDLVRWIGLNPKNEIYTTAGCLTVLRIYWLIICDLPFDIYSTFVLEQKHKFNNETPLFFIKDRILKFFVAQVLLVPLTCMTIWIIKNGGDYFYLYLWIFTVVISLILMIIYPEFIAPLFDKYTPLPEGELRKKIEELASSVGFPLYKLYIVEGSKRSSHSNAYLYGFHKHKRIVLFDTLVAEYQRKKLETDQQEKPENADDEEKKTKEEKEIRGCETDEIIAVLAHELGHWHHSHAILNFLLSEVIMLGNFILFAQLMNYSPVYEAFEFHDSKPILIGLMIITSHVLAPVNKLLIWMMTAMSRRFEFQADTYAVKLGYSEPLARALIKLHKDNLGYPLFDRLYSNWHHSHPPLLERLDALKKDD